MPQFEIEPNRGKHASWRTEYARANFHRTGGYGVIAGQESLSGSPAYSFADFTVPAGTARVVAQPIGENDYRYRVHDSIQAEDGFSAIHRDFIEMSIAEFENFAIEAGSDFTIVVSYYTLY